VRRRIVIGVIAAIGLAVGVGVLVNVVSQPKPGTVEYHKKEFRVARKEFYQVKWYHPITRFLPIPDRRQPLSPSELMALEKRQAVHREELIKLGYLVERRFTFSNQPAETIIGSVMSRARSVIPDETGYYTGVALVTSNAIVLKVAPADAPKWEKLIREADVPEEGN
jgi:hypothetical protein